MWMFEERPYLLMHGDCLERMREIPSGSIDLVLTDPPYNIGVETKVDGKGRVNAWDVIEGYRDWCADWLAECRRVLRDNGVMYIWHNQLRDICHLVEDAEALGMELVSFCIWDKGEAYRAQSWYNRRPDGDTALRSWFNRCEYCLHLAVGGSGARSATGTDRINSNPACWQPLKDWYRGELARLGITERDIARKYTEATGRKPYMLKHYFRDSQFEIPTREVWEAVYAPLGFGLSYEQLRAQYEQLRAQYEQLRAQYEQLRYAHNVDAMHCNVWQRKPLPSVKGRATCEKPEGLLRRIVRVSSREGAVVLDLFSGSGSTGAACMREGRRFIGIERDDHWFDVTCDRVEEAWKQGQDLTREARA